MVQQQMYEPEFDSEKFRQLVLYIADQSREDEWFGAIKLNKLLYYCDFQAFAWLRESITGATYVKLREGPAPRQMLEQRSILIGEGDAVLKTRPMFRYSQHRLTPTSTGHVLGGAFSADEKRIVDATIHSFWNLTGTQISEMSHAEMGWIVTEDNERIPYESVLLVSPNQEDAWMSMNNGD